MTTMQALLFPRSAATQIPEPPIARFLFADTRLAWFWLIVRVYVGWQWLEAGWEKFQNPAWISTGTALQGFLQRAVTVEPKPVAAFDWYRGFLQVLIGENARRCVAAECSDFRLGQCDLS